MLRPFTHLAWIVAFSFVTANAAAQERDYPNRPIRLVVGFSAGGTTDFMARLANEDLNSHAEFHLRSPADPIS